jgi:hypothetical protein
MLIIERREKSVAKGKRIYPTPHGGFMKVGKRLRHRSLQRVLVRIQFTHVSVSIKLHSSHELKEKRQGTF